MRLGRFRGRALFAGMIYAPLVLPEVITGLSLLLLFVAIGVDRGFWTITVAHTTLTMCFVTVVVQSRLASFDVSRSLPLESRLTAPYRSRILRICTGDVFGALNLIRLEKLHFPKRGKSPGRPFLLRNSG